MKKTIEILFKTGIYYSVILSTPVLGAPTELKEGADKARPDGATQSLPAAFNNIANILIFLVGAIAVLVLILGGLTYVTSTGDAARIKRAKDTILYGVVGIVVAILAYAIVNFVIGAL
jgi:hypothetical protein